jgi:hypothetical protein
MLTDQESAAGSPLRGTTGRSSCTSALHDYADRLTDRRVQLGSVAPDKAKLSTY